MKIVLFLAGELVNPDPLRPLVEAADFVVAADGGAEHAVRLGVLPDLLVGDFDSLTEGTEEALVASGHTRFIRLPRDKNETDGERACHLILQELAKRQVPATRAELLVVGALGGRLDHELSMLLHLASLAHHFSRLQLSDGERLLCLLSGPDRTDIVWPPDPHLAAEALTVSVVALDDRVEGLSYEGLVWPLDDFRLPYGSTRAVSNETADRKKARFSVSLKEGLLALLVTP